MSSSHILHMTAHGELCSGQAPLLTFSVTQVCLEVALCGQKRWSGQSRDRDEVSEPLKRGHPSCSQALCRQTRASPGFGLILSMHQQMVQLVGIGKFRHDQQLLSQTWVEWRERLFPSPEPRARQSSHTACHLFYSLYHLYWAGPTSWSSPSTAHWWPPCPLM